MNERTRTMRDALLSGVHHVHRRPANPEHDEAFAADLAARGVAPVLRASARLADVLRRETPVILPGERISLLRTVPTVPEIFTPAERAQQAADHRIHELGKISNVTPDYAPIIAAGLLASRDQAVSALPGADDDTREFLAAVAESIDAVLDLVDRYAAEARRLGRDDLADSLTRATRTGATTFQEALQVFRVLHFALWASFNYHNTIGRFDLNFWPYLEADLAVGRLDEASALELVEEFFLSFNRDSDLYPGQQQGDNGQSLVLGGVDRDGAEVWNLLSELSLEASLGLGLIDRRSTSGSAARPTSSGSSPAPGSPRGASASRSTRTTTSSSPVSSHSATTSATHATTPSRRAGSSSSRARAWTSRTSPRCPSRRRSTPSCAAIS